VTQDFNSRFVGTSTLAAAAVSLFRFNSDPHYGWGGTETLRPLGNKPFVDRSSPPLVLGAVGMKRRCRVFPHRGCAPQFLVACPGSSFVEKERGWADMTYSLEPTASRF